MADSGCRSVSQTGANSVLVTLAVQRGSDLVIFYCPHGHTNLPVRPGASPGGRRAATFLVPDPMPSTVWGASQFSVTEEGEEEEEEIQQCTDQRNQGCLCGTQVSRHQPGKWLHLYRN